MLITCDIGNTHIVTGIFDSEGNVLLTFRIATNEKMTEDEFFSYFRNISKFNNIRIEEVKGVIISSVVPNLITIFQFFGRKYFKVEPIVVDCTLKLPFTFASHINPTGFGADRIIDIVQAVKDFPDKETLIVFDLGTATTYDVLQKNVRIGGGILPGIEMGINALCNNTAKLPKVKFTSPESVLGKDTMTQIQAGVFYGYAGQIKHIVRKIKEIVGEDAYVIATGGLGKILSAEIEEIDEYCNDLSIKGLYSIYQDNKEMLKNNN